MTPDTINDLIAEANEARAAYKAADSDLRYQYHLGRFRGIAYALAQLGVEGAVPTWTLGQP
jgi:hypothetical protein